MIETQRVVYTCIQKNPGIHQRELQRRTNIPLGTLQHHISYLIRHKLIKESRQHNVTHFFSTDITDSDKVLHGLLRHKQLRRILALLVQQNLTNKQLAEQTQLSQAAISGYLKRLEHHNIIEKRKIKNKTKVVQLLITYKVSYLDTVIDNIIDSWQDI